MNALSKIWMYVDPVLPLHDALAAAIEAARRSGGALELVAAIGRSEDRIFQTSFGLQLLRIVREDREARLRDAAILARDALGAGRVQATLLEGEVPWHSLVLHALERAPDLVVVPAGSPARAGFDSPTQHLFRKCPAPVWAVAPSPTPFPRRVLAAVDPGSAGSAERRLARRVLTFAGRLAAGGPLELHVVHAWSLPGEGLLHARFGRRSAQRHLEARRAAAAEQLDQLLSQADLRGAAAVHLLRGDPAQVVPAAAERLDADLVALGTTGRTGLAGFLIGSAAEAIVAALSRSALVVKPEGFVSPVRAAAEDGPRAAGGAS
jgi:nucleotide-binding universal stress UspA family protein